MKTILLPALFALSTYAAQACSCFYISDYFCPAVSWVNTNGGSPGLYIAQVKIVSRYGYYMDVEVIENLQNQLPASLTILGQDGLNCNEWLGGFEEGKAYIVAINSSLWEENVFDLSGCGRFWLSVVENRVQGNIAEGAQEQSYEAFKQNLAGCATLSPAPELHPLEAVEVFPNPTAGDLYINELEPETVLDYILYTLSGQAIRNGKVRAGSSPGLSLKGLPDGIYALRLQAGDAVRVRRIVLRRE